MNHTTETPINTTYAVLAYRDLFGTGYLVHEASHVTAAVTDGWQVLVSGCNREYADSICQIYKTAGRGETQSPDLSDLLTYDMTLPIAERVSESAEEYDLVQVKWQGRVIEGIITWFDEDTIELDGFIEMPVSHFLANATLIAKADADCGFVTEYTAYLTEEKSKWDNLYELAVEAQTRMAA
jgi:hypothetical protein